MKKSFNFIALVTFYLIAVAMNVVLFLTMPEGRADEKGFWFVWGFTFVLHAVVWTVATFYLSRKSIDGLVHYPITLTVLIGGFAVYAFVAFKFFFYSFTFNLTLAIIAETCMTVVYLIAILVALFAMGYIGGNQKTVKEKVQFIRLLQADINACLPNVTDPVLTKQLNALAEKVRFSDPMSHESLKGCENEIAALVADVNMKAAMGETEEIEVKIKKINALLDYRNERCKILK